MIGFGLVIYFAAAVGFCFLQVLFSKRASAVPGLILPILSLLFSVAVTSAVLFSAVTDSSFTEVTEDGTYRVVYHNDTNCVEVTYKDTGMPVETYFAEGKLCDAATDSIIPAAGAYDFTETSVVDGGDNDVNFAFGIGGVILVFIFANLPTAAYIIIYAVCREKKKLTLEKMIAQDL